MRHFQLFPRGWFLLQMLSVLGALVAKPATAHVEILSPNGGETLTAGDSFALEWMPTVASHDTQNFDIWYSTASADGPWTTVAMNLPAGDVTVGSLHSHSWSVPNVVDASAWIRIRQDNNVDSDYEDVSDASFAIAVAVLQGDYSGNQVVDAADYTIWRDSLGQQGADLAADGNGDNRVNNADYALWKTDFGETSGAGAGAIDAVTVPEPASGLLLVGLIVSRFRRSRS